MLITPDSRSAYVLNLYGNSVTPMVLTGDRPAVQDPIGLNGGTFPIDLVLSNGGKELIVANAVGSTLTPIDLTASPPKAGSLVTLGVLARPAGIALLTRDVPPGEATKTQLTSSPSPSLRRRPATFTAKVSTSSGAAAAGAVTFKLDGNVVGTPVTLDDNGVASMSTDELSVGQHHVVARFSGDSRFRSSADQLRHTVDVAPTTTRISASANPTVFGQHVVVTAAVTPNAPAGGTPSGVVTFKVDSKPVGSPVPLVKGSATAALLQLAPGPHEITADYSGGGGYQASQASLSPPYRVNRAATTVTIEAAANDLRQGDPNLFLATVSSVAPGRGVPDGSVAFTVDGVASGGPIVLVGGQALQTLELTPGRHRIGATYTGAANYEPSTGAIDRDIQP